MANNMTDVYNRRDIELDEELAEVLIAISVISKRLAKKSQQILWQRRQNWKKFKHYGLTGETVKVKFKKGHSEAYPWQGKADPVLITGEYDNFLSGTVLPHYAPHGFGLSKPYPITKGQGYS